MKMSFPSTKLAVFLTLGTIAGFTSNAFAIPTQPSIKISQNLPPVPPVDTPGSSQGGSGTRPSESKCPTVTNPPVAFLPIDAAIMTESPTFLFYIPYDSKDIAYVEFTIVDEQEDNEIQRSEKQQISGTPGFINLHLSSTSPSLEIGKSYLWYFTIFCDAKNLEDKITFQSPIQRIAPNSELMQQLQAATPKERIRVYQQAGKWYEALTLLAELRRENPNDSALKAMWDELLSDPSYREIRSYPISPLKTFD